MTDQSHDGPAPGAAGLVETKGSVAEVFWAFLRLGLTSFGGPVAHLSYFHEDIVQRRRWIGEGEYAELIAVCQFLPGPASSQVGYALGVLRAGAWGGLAAFTAFTLPSALLMVAFAFGAAQFQGPWAEGLSHGLKLVAVAVVAHAVWGMARTMASDIFRAAIAGAALLIVLMTAGVVGQLAAIGVGVVAGAWLPGSVARPDQQTLAIPISRRAGLTALAIFSGLLVGLPVLAAATGWQATALVNVFYRAGALVFGGGHVVLPLLEEGVVRPGWIGADAFVTGYGAAQAVPGPLFSFAAFLGFSSQPWPNGIVGAALCLAAVFLPGLLLVTAALPFWDVLRRRRLVQASMRGANAAVVGILAAALYSPVATSALFSRADFVVAAAGFLLLAVLRAPAWLVVLLTAAGGALVSILV
jgi:chromate transporter